MSAATQNSVSNHVPSSLPIPTLGYFRGLRVSCLHFCFTSFWVTHLPQGFPFLSRSEYVTKNTSVEEVELTWQSSRHTLAQMPTTPRITASLLVLHATQPLFKTWAFWFLLPQSSASLTSTPTELLPCPLRTLFAEHLTQNPQTLSSLLKVTFLGLFLLVLIIKILDMYTSLSVLVFSTLWNRLQERTLSTVLSSVSGPMLGSLYTLHKYLLKGRLNHQDCSQVCHCSHFKSKDV